MKLRGPPWLWLVYISWSLPFSGEYSIVLVQEKTLIGLCCDLGMCHISRWWVSFSIAMLVGRKDADEWLPLLYCEVYPFKWVHFTLSMLWITTLTRICRLLTVGFHEVSLFFPHYGVSICADLHGIRWATHSLVWWHALTYTPLSSIVSTITSFNVRFLTTTPGFIHLGFGIIVYWFYVRLAIKQRTRGELRECQVVYSG